MMKRKLLCFLLFVCLLFPVGSTLVYAAEEELRYVPFVDEVAGLEEPSFAFEYIPELKYEHKFLWFEFGEAETVSWDVDRVTIHYTLNIEHRNAALVGYNFHDMEFVIKFEFRSVDPDGNYHDSLYVMHSPTNDYDTVPEDGYYTGFNFGYDMIRGYSEYYKAGYPTVLTALEICPASTVLGTCGTAVRYEFDCEDYKSQIYTGIRRYEIKGDNKKLISNLAASFKGDDDGTGDGNGGEVETHYYVSVLPDSRQENMFRLNELAEMVLIEFPRMLWDVLVFLFELIVYLPECIHKLVPFLPENVISALMFCMLFGLVWGILKKWKKLKE